VVKLKPTFNKLSFMTLATSFILEASQVSYQNHENVARQSNDIDFQTQNYFEA
jgi:hypothetical protein